MRTVEYIGQANPISLKLGGNQGAWLLAEVECDQAWVFLLHNSDWVLRGSKGREGKQGVTEEKIKCHLPDLEWKIRTSSEPSEGNGQRFNVDSSLRAPTWGLKRVG